MAAKTPHSEETETLLDLQRQLEETRAELQAQLEEAKKATLELDRQLAAASADRDAALVRVSRLTALYEGVTNRVIPTLTSLVEEV